MRIDQTPPPTIYGPSSSQEAAWPPEIDKVRQELNDLTALFDKVSRKGRVPISDKTKAQIVKQIEMIEHQLKEIMSSLPQGQKEYVQTMLDNLDLLHEYVEGSHDCGSLLSMYNLIFNSIAQIPPWNSPVVPIDEITKSVEELLKEMQQDKGKRLSFDPELRQYWEKLSKLSSEINNYLLHTDLPDTDRARLRECSLILNGLSTEFIWYGYDTWYIDDDLIQDVKDLIQKLKG